MEHQVVDDELGPAAEEIGEPDFARGAGKAVVLDSLPRQRASRRAQPVACPGEGFLLRQQPLARREPFLMRDDLMRCHRYLLQPFACRAGGGGIVFLKLGRCALRS
jgi:hypothetical protein